MQEGTELWCVGFTEGPALWDGTEGLELCLSILHTERFKNQSGEAFLFNCSLFLACVCVYVQ